MAADSLLVQKIKSTAPGSGTSWDPFEAMVELLCSRLDTISAAVGGTSGTDEYVSVINLETTSGSIPVGALSWSITAVSGTVTVSGDALTTGQSVGGGGYAGKTLKTAISYTITAGSALVAYDTVG